IDISAEPVLPKKTAHDSAVKAPAAIDVSCQAPDITIDTPVIEQMTKVSNKTCVIDTSACLPGISVLTAAAAIVAEPKPASFENNPRAIPKRSEEHTSE